jgi:hypothetical protein
MPGMIVSSFAALARFAPAKKQPWWALAVPLLLIALSVVGDIEYVSAPAEDLRTEAEMIRPQLFGDSCVVFVSEGLSKDLFLMLDPSLEPRICQNFFHHRAVLASHAYVRPAQQENAESFFRGLNFIEVKRWRVGGGQIVIVENNDKLPATLY